MNSIFLPFPVYLYCKNLLISYNGAILFYCIGTRFESKVEAFLKLIDQFSAINLEDFQCMLTAETGYLLGICRPF